MRLVLLYLGRRGAGPVYSIEFAQALLEKQVPILAIVSNYSGNINEWMLLSRKFRNLSLVTIDTYTNKKDFVIRSLNICLFAKLVRIIRKYSPDYVFTPMIHPWHNLVISLLPRKIKIIKVIHDVAPHLGESNLFSMLMNKADIFFSDRLVVLSQHSRKELEKAGIKKNICISPHANFSYYSKYNDLATERKIYNKVGFFGRINKYKGLDVLLESWGMIKDTNPKLKLLVAGNGDCQEYVGSFNRYKDSMEICNRWISDEEVAKLLSSVDLIILPYIEASQSGVIPLAFALGKPVVVTNVGGLKEQVPDGCGLIIPPNNPKALSDAICELYNNPSKILDMGADARIYAQNVLSWDKSAAILLDNLNFKK